ncbi:RelA/SpoT domain-containing protein [Verrucomicrobiota bacterium]
MSKTLSKRTEKQIDAAVNLYKNRMDDFRLLAQTLLLNLTEDSKLRTLIHSTKLRTKDPEHLRDKLVRRALEAKKKGRILGIDESNVFKIVEDLAGVRLLHLHTKQMAQIHPTILNVLKEHRYRVIGKPAANTWDIEHQAFFKNLGMKTNLRPSMYTSVHYIIMANRRTQMRCELQVRTLMEEVWGEVSHMINYPHETKSVICQEQLKVLARVASGGARLVDAIFLAHQEHAKKRSHCRSVSGRH